MAELTRWRKHNELIFDKRSKMATFSDKIYSAESILKKISISVGVMIFAPEAAIIYAILGQFVGNLVQNVVYFVGIFVSSVIVISAQTFLIYRTISFVWWVVCAKKYVRECDEIIAEYELKTVDFVDALIASEDKLDKTNKERERVS